MCLVAVTSGRSIMELITRASLVEKDVNDDDDHERNYVVMYMSDTRVEVLQ